MVETEQFEMALFTTIKHLNEHVKKITTLNESLTYEDYKLLEKAENILDKVSVVGIK